MIVCFSDMGEPANPTYAQLTDEQFRLLQWLEKKVYLHQDIEYQITDLPQPEVI